MAGGRQAWCPRCDELRAGRPGAACPVCGRRLLAVPSARPGAPGPGPADRLARRLRGLLPAAGAAGVGLLVVAAVAGGFAAGRLTRTTPSAPAAAPATTVGGFLDEGPETGRRDFNWRAAAAGITVVLRSVTVGTGFSRLELHVDGVPRGREVSALEALRIRDGAGRDLLAGGAIASIATAASRPAPGSGIDTEVVLDRQLDQQAVASVELGGLTVARHVEERLVGSLTDPELRRRAHDNVEDEEWLSARGDCPGCRLQVSCQDCRSLRLAGSTYRRGRILLALEAVGPVQRTALSPSRRRVTVTDEAGIAELGAWIDGTGETAVVSAMAGQLALVGPTGGPDTEAMGFDVEVEAQAERTLRGRWVIRQPGSA
jgi:hypothetical protein